MHIYIYRERERELENVLTTISLIVLSTRSCGMAILQQCFHVFKLEIECSPQ